MLPEELRRLFLGGGSAVAAGILGESGGLPCSGAKIAHRVIVAFVLTAWHQQQALIRVREQFHVELRRSYSLIRSMSHSDI